MPTTVYDKTSTMLGTDDGDSDNNINQRQVIKATLLSAATGDQIRITGYFGTACTTTSSAVSSMFVGQGAAAGNEYNFTGNQVAVTFGGVGTINSVAGATCTLGTISTTVLTVAGTVTGTFSVGQVISGAGVTLGTTITSLGTGAGGTGTYNLSASSTVSVGEVISANWPVVSDFITLGESFDNTKNYVVAYHTINAGGPSYSSAGITNADNCADGGGTDSSSSTSVSLSIFANSATFITKLEIQSGGDVLASQIWL